MINLKSILWLLPLSLLVSPLLYGENLPDKWYKGTIQATAIELQQVGDSLHIQVLYDLDKIKVSSNHSIELIPVLIAANHQLKLPEISVKGRSNFQNLKRKLALMNTQERDFYLSEAPYCVVKGYGITEEKQIRYFLVIPFESWMKDARLDIKKEVMGCCKPGKLLSAFPLFGTVTLEQPPVPYHIVPHISYVRPQVEPVKKREMSCEAFLDFVVSKTIIRPDYMNNPVELEKISSMLTEVKNDTTITIRGISVVGYASPEGSTLFNKRLSEGRAKTLVDYLLPRFPFAEELYKVEYGGENWDGLRQMVAASDMTEKEGILHIIDHIPVAINYHTNTSRKKSLMLYKQGNPYRFMLHEYYPHLRKAICKIEYDVQNFNIEQAKLLIHSRPKNLSLNEIYLVALTYKNGSPEFIELFEKAVSLFPDDKVANLNAASAALSRGDIALAEKHLKKAKISAPEYENAVGVLYLLKGDYEQAKQHLNKAAESGLEQAYFNLEELNKKEEDIRSMSKLDY